MTDSKRIWEDLRKLEPHTIDQHGFTYEFRKKHAQVNALLDQVDFKYIEYRACKVRRQKDSQVSKNLSCRADRRELQCGQHQIVVPLHFSDGKVWVTRFQYRPYSSDPKENDLRFQCEVAVGHIVHGHTTVPAPAIYDHVSLKDSLLGCPFMLMEHLPGKKMAFNEIPSQHRRRVADQFTDAFSALLALTSDKLGMVSGMCPGSSRLDVIESKGLTPATTPHEYLQRQARIITQEILSSGQGDAAELARLTTRAWMTKLAPNLILENASDSGPFPLAHGNLNSESLLFDNDYNIVGVLGWSYARTVPWELVPISRELFASDPSRMLQNLQITDYTENEWRREVLRAMIFKPHLANHSWHKQPCKWTYPLHDLVRSRIFDAAFCFERMADSDGVGEVLGKILFPSLTWAQLVETYGQRADEL